MAAEDETTHEQIIITDIILHTNLGNSANTHTHTHNHWKSIHFGIEATVVGRTKAGVKCTHSTNTRYGNEIFMQYKPRNST